MKAEKFPKNWVLIRGLIRSKFHWNDFPQKFQAGVAADNVVTVELPGNGFLFDRQTPLSLNEIVKEFESQIPDSNEPWGLVGISLGGMLGTAWAQMRPGKFSHLVLINSSSAESPFYHRLKPANYLKILNALATNNPEATEEFILSITSNKDAIWKKHLAGNTEFLKSHPVSSRNFLRQMKVASLTDFKKIPGQKKLILSSKADRLVSYKCSEQISKLWNCPVYYHQEAGHDLPLDDADWVIESIKKEFQ